MNISTVMVVYGSKKIKTGPFLVMFWTGELYNNKYKTWIGKILRFQSASRNR